MRGWATPKTQESMDALYDKERDFEIIGVVVDKNFPDDVLESSLASGVARYPDAVWVVRATDKRAAEVLSRHGVEAVLAPLVPYYRVTGTLEDGTKVSHDSRKIMRDCAITNYCTRVIVYRDLNSAVSKWWTETGHRNDHVRVVEGGEKKKRYKKGKAPS